MMEMPYEMLRCLMTTEICINDTSYYQCFTVSASMPVTLSVIYGLISTCQSDCGNHLPSVSCFELHIHCYVLQTQCKIRDVSNNSYYYIIQPSILSEQLCLTHTSFQVSLLPPPFHVDKTIDNIPTFTHSTPAYHFWTSRWEVRYQAVIYPFSNDDAETFTPTFENLITKSVTVGIGKM